MVVIAEEETGVIVGEEVAMGAAAMEVVAMGEGITEEGVITEVMEAAMEGEETMEVQASLVDF